MRTLEEAWQWYNDASNSLKRMRRIGVRYWDNIPWDQPPWMSDNRLIALEKEDVIGPAGNALHHLDDLAILVLFSVFEATVRAALLGQIEKEEPPGCHRIISKAIEAAKDRVSEGSFFAVLEVYKGADDKLLEEVNQVRKYRNWVAHGKRTEQPAVVTPRGAYDRLTRFLALFYPSPVITDDWIDLLRENGD